MKIVGGSGMLASLVIVAVSLSPLQVLLGISYDGEHMLFAMSTVCVRTWYVHGRNTVRNKRNDISSSVRQPTEESITRAARIGFRRNNKENIVNLFDWDKGEVKELNPETHLSIKNIVVLFISAS
jgi:hypothetical protein